MHGTGDISILQTGNRIAFENPIPEGNPPNPEQLFDRFYKSDPSRRKGSSGLGLFIVRELMRKMGGDAEAGLEGGALRITLCFPEDSRGDRPV
nr:ATP-binding protein [uncultured Acetatifactor sp.]